MTELLELKDYLGIKFDAIDRRFDKVDIRLDQVDYRLDMVDYRLDHLEQRVDVAEGLIRGVYDNLDAYAKHADDYAQETQLLIRQVNRHDGWIHELADSAHIKLVH
jgi:hypothetical protein